MATQQSTTAEHYVPEDSILELTDISVRYGVVNALDRVSLGVRDGEAVAVMGPNGAGKSTVLKAIMGLAPVVAGEVLWRREPLAAATHEIVKEGIAFVPQGRRVFTHLTIAENLEMGCLHLNDRAEKRRRLNSVMELFPVLYEKRRDMGSQMSGGQQQMLALGRGLMANPEALLLDEPTLGLAPIIVKEVFSKVSEILEGVGDQRASGDDDHGGGAQHQGRAGDRRPGVCAGQGPRGVRGDAADYPGERHTDAGFPWRRWRRRGAGELDCVRRVRRGCGRSSGKGMRSTYKEI